MIETCSHKGLEDFFYDGAKKDIQPKHAQKISDILDLLDTAAPVKDLNFPGSCPHPLKGTRKGEWAVKISGNWRIRFKFIAGNTHDVNYDDYH